MLVWCLELNRMYNICFKDHTTAPHSVRPWLLLLHTAHHPGSYSLTIPFGLWNEPVPLQIYVFDVRFVQLELEPPEQRRKDKVHFRIAQVVSHAVTGTLTVGVEVLPHETGGAVGFGVDPTLGFEGPTIGEYVRMVVDEDHNRADWRAGGNSPVFVLHIGVGDALRACGNAVVQTKAFLNTCVQDGQFFQFIYRW